MKTSKLVAQNSGQNKEDCGVWLDTVQLKGKAKKKRSARPISKLLNPFADGAGYNVAVALNFTQTKIEMPKTKQSSISNFFTGQRRVLNKMSTTGEPKQEACFPSACPSVMTTKSATEYLADLSNEPLWCDVDFKQGNDQLTEPEPLMWWQKEEESQNINSDFEEKTSVDKRIFEDALLSDNHERHKLKTHSQKHVHNNSEPNFQISLPSQNEFNTFGENVLNTEGRTSTQRTSKGLSLQNDKENTISKSPKKIIPDSQIQSMPKKTKLEPLNILNEGFNSPYKWTKPKSSPIKKQNWQSFKDSDDESFSMLFTQDSQGFRVIAHRGPKTRSPFKDQSNVSALVPSEIKSLVEDEDEEMLFTQDSQGNMVIKH